LVNQKLRGQREVIEEARTKVEDMLRARGMEAKVEGE